MYHVSQIEYDSDKDNAICGNVTNFTLVEKALLCRECYCILSTLVVLGRTLIVVFHMICKLAGVPYCCDVYVVLGGHLL